jgi:quercetin dioxygenase-like cupin family protein
MPIPADDPSRNLTHSNPDAPNTPHIGLVGDTYTVLLSAKDTAGKYCLIDMHIPPGGGPPPHRHDFEETFTVLDGEIEATFRGAKTTVKAGETIHIPANAPHQFRNAATHPARLLCICALAGQEDFFAQVGVPVPTRTAPPPRPTPEAEAKFRKLAAELAPKNKTEFLPPAW